MFRKPDSFVVFFFQFNSHLKVLNVSHNRLSDEGAFTVGRAIGKVFLSYAGDENMIESFVVYV
jgi:hypothetical protein